MAKPILSTPSLNEKQYEKILRQVIPVDEGKTERREIVLTERAEGMKKVYSTEDLEKVLAQSRKS